MSDVDQKPPEYLVQFFNRWRITVTYLAIIVTIDVIVQLAALIKG